MIQCFEWCLLWSSSVSCNSFQEGFLSIVGSLKGVKHIILLSQVPLCLSVCVRVCVCWEGETERHLVKKMNFFIVVWLVCSCLFIKVLAAFKPSWKAMWENRLSKMKRRLWHQESPTPSSGLACYKILQVESKALALKRYYSIQC